MTKQERLLKRMDSVVARASKHWRRHYKLNDQFTDTKEALEQAGLWEEWCSNNNWSPEAGFNDLGA